MLMLQLFSYQFAVGHSQRWYCTGIRPALGICEHHHLCGWQPTVCDHLGRQIDAHMGVGHSCGHEVHCRPHYAFHAGGHIGAQWQMDGLPVVRQQDRHLLRPQSLQDEPQKDLHRSHGLWLRLPTGLFAGHELSGVGRWRWQMLYLGLEDDEDVQEVAGARRRLHQCPLASAWGQQSGHRWLGWPDKILGLMVRTK